MKTIIVGGVAAGAGAAARLRRLDEKAEIIMLERGDYISYANCGLPYHIGGEIPLRDSLLVMPEKTFAARFNVDVRSRHEAVAIDKVAKTVSIRRPDGEVVVESYDKLLLATGSSPIVPPLPGIDHPRVHRLWTIPDMDAIKKLADSGARSALVVGGGFIGLETAENLRELGMEVTLVEFMPQILPTLDAEMTAPLAEEMEGLGIRMELGRKVVALAPDGEGVVAQLDDGRSIVAELVIMSVGVRPNSALAKDAGLDLGERGHIVVDEYLRTSDPDIYAAGDAVEVLDPILGGKTAIPLAGPANKQGRIAADNIHGGAVRYRGSMGAAILKLGNLAAASVGYTQQRLERLGVEYRKIYLHPASNASYYPGWGRLHTKLLFSPQGKILGAQIVGTHGADKRLDVIATAMHSGLDVRELAELELCYAPPFNSAKDPVNLAGMMAQNLLDGDTRAVYADAIPEGALLLDIRDAAECGTGTIPGSVHIPLDELRGRLDELPADRPVVAFCQIGLRGYIAERMLRQYGLDAFNLSGGYATWRMFHPAG